MQLWFELLPHWEHEKYAASSLACKQYASRDFSCTCDQWLHQQRAASGPINSDVDSRRRQCMSTVALFLVSSRSLKICVEEEISGRLMKYLHVSVWHTLTFHIPESISQWIARFRCRLRQKVRAVTRRENVCGRSDAFDGRRSSRYCKGQVEVKVCVFLKKLIASGVTAHYCILCFV